jgi:hypothetical protein
MSQRRELTCFYACMSQGSEFQSLMGVLDATQDQCDNALYMKSISSEKMQSNSAVVATRLSCSVAQCSVLCVGRHLVA